MVHVLDDVVALRELQRASEEGRDLLAGKKVLERVAGQNRPCRQDRERDEHHHRALVGVIVVRAIVRMTVERHQDEPPGIERGEGRRRDRAGEGVDRRGALGGVGRLDDRILGEVAGRQREPGQRQRADDHHRIGERDLVLEPAHLPDVLLVMHGHDHRARAEEQEGLEEGMGEQMEHSDRVGADAHGDEHVAELRAGRIGDDALDVVLYQADSRGEQGGRGADDDHKGLRDRRELKERRQPRHHEHARRHHGGGVDQRGHRRRPFHGVRQPGMQQELGRLAHRAHEQEEADQRQRIDVPGQEMNGLAGQRRRLRKDCGEIHRSSHHEDRKDAERKAEVANAIDHEGLDRRRIRLRLMKPESDEQIAHQPNALPAEEQLDQIVGRHQRQHREGEQRQIGEEARPVRVLFHVADGIEVDEGRDRGHHHEHDRCERVDP